MSRRTAGTIVWHLILPLAALAWIGSGPRAGTIALAGGTLIDGTASPPLPDAVVVVHGDRIVAAGARRTVHVPPDATVIDVRGGWILPGIIDSHVHLGRLFRDPGARPDVWTRAGVTTLVENGSAFLSPKALRTRAANSRDAPRLLVAGPIFTAPGGYPTLDGPQDETIFLTSPAQAADAVGRVIDRDGIDFVKIAVERGFTSDYDEPGWPVLSPPVIAAVVRAAHARGRPVRAHVTQAREMEVAVDAGVDALAHAPLGVVSDAILRKAVARGVIMVATLDLWPPAELRGAVRNVRRFRELGGKVALGSDYPTAGRPGLPIEEMRALREAGMNPAEILEAATKIGAEAAGRAGTLGTLEAGRLADLIVIARSPLNDLEALREVRLVMRGGEVIAAQSRGR